MKCNIALTLYLLEDIIGFKEKTDTGIKQRSLPQTVEAGSFV
jgi:hypothetical protein